MKLKTEIVNKREFERSMAIVSTRIDEVTAEIVNTQLMYAAKHANRVTHKSTEQQRNSASDR